MVNSHTKFEVSMLIQCEDTKGNAKCRNSNGVGWLGVSQSHRERNHSIERIRYRL